MIRRRFLGFLPVFGLAPATAILASDDVPKTTFLIHPDVVAMKFPAVADRFRQRFPHGCPADPVTINSLLKEFNWAAPKLIWELALPITGHIVTDGAQYWYRDGKIHRDDGPAAIDVNSHRWYRDGKLHRDDGPASVYDNGAEYWYRDGKIHRDDGPAVISGNRSQYWYRDGKLHRDDGPAVIYVDGSQEWYRDGKCVATELPVVVHPNGSQC